jgi:hypothetical protein
MLEQAIVDAAELREAALRSAEAAIVEKYTDEVKTVLQTLLEEEDMETDDMDMESEEETSTAMEQVPMSHLSGDGEDEMVVVDLDDIMAAAEADPETEDADASLSRDEIADEVGIELDAEDMVANRKDDEIEISESELVEMFKETLVVDVPPAAMEHSMEELDDDEKQEEEKVETVRVDGMNEDDIEEYERTMAKNESLHKEVKILKKVLTTVKAKLEENNLQNARLLYANRVLADISLNEQQKSKIVDMIGQATTVDEAKMVYETLLKTMATPAERGPKSLSEAVSRPSSIILGARKRNDETTNTANPTYNRWAKLAGTNLDS